MTTKPQRSVKMVVVAWFSDNVRYNEGLYIIDTRVIILQCRRWIDANGLEWRGFPTKTKKRDISWLTYTDDWLTLWCPLLPYGYSY